jgi:hypothetical protein
MPTKTPTTKTPLPGGSGRGEDLPPAPGGLQEAGFVRRRLDERPVSQKVLPAVRKGSVLTAQSGARRMFGRAGSPGRPVGIPRGRLPRGPGQAGR